MSASVAHFGSQRSVRNDVSSPSLQIPNPEQRAFQGLACTTVLLKHLDQDLAQDCVSHLTHESNMPDEQSDRSIPYNSQICAVLNP
jgi:hypothetical protein